MKKREKKKVTTLRYWHGAAYTGEVMDGLAWGKGTYTTKDGRVVECEWEADRPKPIEGTHESTGRITYPNGDVYEGYIGSGIIGIIGNAHGVGVYTYADGRVYKGEFVENEQWGEGVMTWPDGRSFRGHFYKDAPDGNGVMTYPDGQRVEGYFEGDELIPPEVLAERALARRRHLEEACQVLYGGETDISKRLAILRDAFSQSHNSGYSDHMAWELAAGKEDPGTSYWQEACRLKYEVEALCEIYEEELAQKKAGWLTRLLRRDKK